MSDINVVTKEGLTFAQNMINDMLAKKDTSYKSLNNEELRQKRQKDLEEAFSSIECGIVDDEEDKEPLEFDVDSTLERKPKGYSDSTPLTVGNLMAVLKETLANRTPFEKELNDTSFNTGFTSTPHREEAANKKSKYEDTVYGEGQYEILGKSKKCTEVAFNLDLSKYSNHFEKGDVEGNMKLLSDTITYQIIKNFPKVHSIAVCDNYLLINDTCFTPNIVNTDAKFPLDSHVYLKNSMIAPFVDWNKLLKHASSTCGIISFDSSEFYVIYVGDSLGLGRSIGVSTMFKKVSALDTFYLEGETVTREKLNHPESSKVKKKLASRKRNINILDGYQLNVCSGTQSFQNWSFDNLKSYATSRGNKGFIRYSLGTIARAGMATGAGILNLGTHLVRGTFNTIKSAITGLNDEDLPTN